MTAPQQSPDRVLRESLGTPANLRDFLDSPLPDHVAHFDITKLQEVTPEVFTGDWHEREADLLFAAASAADRVCGSNDNIRDLFGEPVALNALSPSD